MNTLNQVLQSAAVIIASLYAIATAVGSMTPNSKLGQFCRRFAADLHQIAPAATKDTPQQPQDTGKQ